MQNLKRSNKTPIFVVVVRREIELFPEWLVSLHKFLAHTIFLISTIH